jgi:hypothetical protein
MVSNFNIVRKALTPQPAYAPTTHTQDQVRKHIENTCKTNPNDSLCKPLNVPQPKEAEKN